MNDYFEYVGTLITDETFRNLDSYKPGFHKIFVNKNEDYQFILESRVYGKLEQCRIDGFENNIKYNSRLQHLLPILEDLDYREIEQCVIKNIIIDINNN